MKYIYLTVLLLVSLFLAAFIHFNGTPVQLRYFDWVTPYLPVSIYMIVCFVAGWFIHMLASFATGVRFRFRASGAERELRQLRTELDQLKKAELKAVSDEHAEDTMKPSSPQEKRVGPANEGDETLSWHENDPDEETAFTDSGGEEEK